MRQRNWKPRVTQINDTEAEPAPSNIDPVKAHRRTMERAVKLLAVKPRSVEELRLRLLERKYASDEIVDSVIERLKEYDFLNDERFAVGYASFKLRQRPLGRRRLERALELKRVARTIADEALRVVFEQTPERELIERAVSKRLRLRGQPKTRAQTKSLIDHLLRQGFSYELVIEKVREASISNLDDGDSL